MSENKQRKLSIAAKIFIGMVLGGITGYLVGPRIDILQPISDVFIRLLRMCMYPLIFFSIISGVSEISDMTRLKKVGFSFMSYWAVSSALAGVIGLLVAQYIQPGVGVNLSGGETYTLAETPDIVSSFVQWIPQNPFSALAQGNLIQIIVFALIAGVVLAGMKNTPSGRMVSEGVGALNHLVMKIVNWVIQLAPFGVFALIAVMAGSLGSQVIGGVMKMLGSIWLAIGIVIFFLYPVVLKLFGLSPVRFYKNVYPAMIMAASTCSSAATLPVTMSVSKDRMGIPEDMVGMLAPPAATINMHATCLEIPIYALFAAQAYGIDFSTTQLMLVILLGVVSSVGSAAVPGGGVVMDAIVLELMGLPLEVIPIIYGVYVLIDMPGTMLNVTGDTVGMASVASWLKELNTKLFNSAKDALTATK